MYTFKQEMGRLMNKLNKKSKGKRKKGSPLNPYIRPGKFADDKVINCREYLSYRRVMYMDHVINAPAGDIILSLLMLDDISHDPITILMYCPGGSIDAGFAICDVMEQIKSPIYTVAFSIQSMAVPVFMCGDRRILSEHARVMLHLPWGMTQGDAREMEIANKEMQKSKDNMVNFLMRKGLNGTRKSILKDIDRDNWMDSGEAINKGIGDEILSEGIQKLIMGKGGK